MVAVVKPDSQHKRTFALDALRAVMMLLGLVIHTGVTFMPFDSHVRTIMANETWIGLYPVINLIHSFRMPVFFLVAGYFGALLFFRKGPEAMLQNRILKILLPMIAGMLILYPAIYFTLTYSGARISGAPDAWQKAWQTIVSGNFLPYRLSHLWFLYDLMLFSVATWLVAILFSKSVALQSFINKLAHLVIPRPVVRILLIGTLYYVGLLLNKEYSLHTNVSFWIDRKLLFCYFIFYVFGWMIYKAGLLESLRWHPLWQIMAGLIAFTAGMYIEFYVKASWAFTALQLVNAFVTTMMTFGVIGLFLLKFDRYSKPLAYVMDAAYFVYLIHVPIALLIPGLLADSGLPAIIQFLITISATTAICFGIYHGCIRGTFISRFLDGKLFTIPSISSRPEKVKTIP